LSTTLATFSQITGISVGFAGDLPRILTRRVTGTMSPEAVLRKLLMGTGLRAVRAGSAIYRIERVSSRRSGRSAMVPSTEDGSGRPASDIIVTAQKRPQNLATVPLSISVLSMADFKAGPRAPTSRDISFGTEGLAMTNLGPGRNRQFIRGVADSPFNGQSQSTVSVQVDDARVTFNAPDPDLRLVDVDRIEILKGPQGPLYGSGALGGIYHIVTRRPDLQHASASVRLSAQGVEHGAVGTGAEGVVNFPLVDDRLAIRAAGYRFLDAGWINTLDTKKDSNSAETVGLRVGALWRPFDNWTVDVGFMLQDINSRDSQYVMASDDTLKRINMIREPTDNDFKLYHGTVEGMVGSLQLLSATSYVDHGFDYVLDASVAASDFGLVGAARFEDQRVYTVFNQELRLSSTGLNHWLVGLSYLRATTHGSATITGDTSDALSVETLDRVVSEYAAFGEGTVRLFSRLDATLGARLFHSTAEDETTEQAGQRALKRGKTILSPSFALSLPLVGRGLAYIRYARAMRPGGLAPGGETSSGRFDADELATIDLGLRRSSLDGRLSLSASAFHTLWSDIQSDYLLANGLVSTRNAGKGKISGLEAAIEWKLSNSLNLSAGGSVQRARLTHAEDGLDLDDRRLPIAPDLTGRLAVTQSFGLGEWNGQASAQANYIGSAHLSFDDDLDRQMGKYAVVAANTEMSHEAWTLGIRIDNLFDVKGDSFAFGNPFSIRSGPQYTPLRPRTLTLSVARTW
jgi:outer membrane receptor protein involved in Fe transport